EGAVEPLHEIVADGADLRAHPGIEAYRKPQAESVSRARIIAPAPGVDLRTKPVRRHQGDRFRTEHPHAVKLAAVDQHLQEARVVRSSRYEATSSTLELRWLADVEQQASSFRRRRQHVGDALLLLRRNPEAGIRHAQRSEYALGQKFAQRHAGQKLEN